MIKMIKMLKRFPAAPVFAVFLVAASGILAAALVSGCGHPEPDPSPPVESLWQASEVVADGKGKDWPEVPPLYYDSKTRTSIWAANDEVWLCLMVSVGSEDVARRLEQSGIVLSLKTREEGAAPFRLELKGGGAKRPDGNGPPPRPDTDASENAPEPPRPDGTALPKKITVSYPYASDAMTMTLDEAAGNGISLGLGHQGHGAWIFEAVIRLDAIYFKAPVPGGSRLDLSLASLGGGRSQGAPGSSGGPGNGGRGPGGPPSGGPPGGGGGSGHGPGKSGGSPDRETAFNPSVTILLSPGPSNPTDR